MCNKHKNRWKWALIGLMIVLLPSLGYLYLSGNRTSQLISYFVYMSIACSFIPLPTPPVLISLGKIFDPVIVALVGAAGNCLAAFVEYYLISWLFAKVELQERIESNRFFKLFAKEFDKRAFFYLLFSSFTPVPLEPFRLAAIAKPYPISKYLLAIFIGRYPRYYLVARLGDQFAIPNSYLFAMLMVMLLIFLIKAYKDS